MSARTGSAHSECPYAAHAGPDELVRFGHALQNDGRLDAAAGCYARTTRLHPAFADGWFEHGLVLQSLGGDLATAVRTFETGLRLRPSDAGRLNAHGVMLQTAGRHAEARRAYSRSVRVPPGLPPARRPPLAPAPPSHARRACHSLRALRPTRRRTSTSARCMRRLAHRQTHSPRVRTPPPLAPRRDSRVHPSLPRRSSQPPRHMPVAAHRPRGARGRRSRRGAHAQQHRRRTRLAGPAAARARSPSPQP